MQNPDFEKEFQEWLEALENVLISDGRELNNFGLKFFDATASTLSGLDIARVEVVRGSSGAVYGLNSTSGVVSITTKNPFDLYFFASSIDRTGIIDLTPFDIAVQIAVVARRTSITTTISNSSLKL